MRVQTAILSDGKERYMLVDDTGQLVRPVLRYLKYKDHVGAARNTLRTYCYHLKLYYEFLAAAKTEFNAITIDDMASFVRWLHNPQKVIPLRSPMQSKRSVRSINQIITVVLGYYDYLFRHTEYEGQINQQLHKQMSMSKSGFRGFLHHASTGKQMAIKLIKLKVPKNKPKTISKGQVALLMDACRNKRDKFMIQLLWESSIRIGEALSLWLEDFEIDRGKIHIRDRGELCNHAEIKTVGSPRTLDVSQELMNQYVEYIAEYHTDEVDTNFVFIKLSGKNRNKPMEYVDVVSRFEQLKSKVGFDVMPHMLRHSSLTELRRSGWKAEHLMLRAGHSHVQTTMQMFATNASFSITVLTIW